MKVISTNAELNRQLLRLIGRYPKVAFATAWASAGTDVFSELVKNEDRIVGAAIGTHFYQTHPDVLDQFVGSSKVKFMLQPSGVFHPKAYLFWSADAWELIVGSANLTTGALTKNSELSVLISSDDAAPGLRNEFLEVIKGYVKDAVTIKQEEADRYRRIWKLKKRDLDVVADMFGDEPARKPSVDSEVMSMDWAGYFAKVKEDQIHGFQERLELLEVVAGYFSAHPSFNDMPLPVRKGIAGLPNEEIPRWAWFGSMKGAMTFGGLINKEHKAFSLALDEIPARGDVTKKHYDAYIAQYLKAFPNGRDGIATSTRLLAMKRPDVFLCVDAQNKRRLGKDIGIKRMDILDYERYWEEVVLRIMQTPWWRSDEPKEPVERAVWRARSAMLDAIFYER
jgi:HKD family nuclease